MENRLEVYSLSKSYYEWINMIKSRGRAHYNNITSLICDLKLIPNEAVACIVRGHFIVTNNLNKLI